MGRGKAVKTDFLKIRVQPELLQLIELIRGNKKLYGKLYSVSDVVTTAVKEYALKTYIPGGQVPIQKLQELINSIK